MMKSNISEQEITELVGIYGAETLEEIVQKSTSDKLKLIEVKYRYEQELKHIQQVLWFWEDGYNSSTKWILGVTATCITTSLLLSKSIVTLYKETNIHPTITISIYLTTLMLASINIFDLGRIKNYLRQFTTKPTAQDQLAEEELREENQLAEETAEEDLTEEEHPEL